MWDLGIRDNIAYISAFALQLLEHPPVLETHVKIRQTQAFLHLANGQFSLVCTFLRVISVGKFCHLRGKPPTTLKLTFPVYCISPSIWMLCLGFPLVLPKSKEDPSHHAPWGTPSFPPSGQGGGLKIPTKCSRICFCAVKRLESKQITFLLDTCDAHYTPPLATSWAAACNGGLLYKKNNGFQPLWCPEGSRPSALIEIGSIQLLKHLAWFTLKCHQNIHI